MNETNKSTVLIAYSDNYEYIVDIADNMSRQLRNSGLNVDNLDLERTKQKRWQDLKGYQGVILISGKKKFFNFWNKKAKKFASFYIGPLEKFLLTGFFRSDPWALDSLKDPVKTNEKFGNDILKTCSFIPNYFEDLGPVLDFSHHSKLKHDDKSTLKDSAKSIAKKTGLEFEYKGVNDFRNWYRIEEICNEYVKKLLQGNKCPTCGTIIPNGANFCVSCGEKMP